MKDHNEKQIKLVSVLRKVDNKKDSGVVEKINSSQDKSIPTFSCVGDMFIRKSSAVRIVSNKYSSWEHVPHSEQTFEQRYYSWMFMDKSFFENEVDMCADLIANLIDEDLVSEDEYPLDYIEAVGLMLRQLKRLEGKAR